MQEIYQRVAELFAQRIEDAFTSEASLEALSQRIFPHLEFSRTHNWSAVLWKLFEEVWLEAGPEVKSSPTPYDKAVLLKLLHPLLDYNLFTQVCLNLQSYAGMAYRALDAEKEVAALKADWKHPKLDPFAPKAKSIKEPQETDERRFNDLISKVRAVNIIARFDGASSFRVSPKGSTPAFADSKNLSMIGVGGDQYLRTLPHLKAYYMVWPRGSCPQLWTSKEEGFESCGAPSGKPLTVLHFPDIPYPLMSKSGGDTANEVMFSRKLMYEVFRDFELVQETGIIIPRMNSVLVVTQAGGVLKKTFERLKILYSVLELREANRNVEVSIER